MQAMHPLRTPVPRPRVEETIPPARVLPAVLAPRDASQLRRASTSSLPVTDDPELAIEKEMRRFWIGREIYWRIALGMLPTGYTRNVWRLYFRAVQERHAIEARWGNRALGL